MRIWIRAGWNRWWNRWVDWISCSLPLLRPPRLSAPSCQVRPSIRLHPDLTSLSAGFQHAPITKACILTTAALSLTIALADLKPYAHIQFVPHMRTYHQVRRPHIPVGSD